VVTLGPPRLRWNTSAVYRSGSWQIGVKSRMTSAARVSREASVIASQGRKTIGSQAYHDFFLSYSLQSSLFAATPIKLRFDALNVLRARPEFDASEVYYQNRYGADERPLYRLSLGIAF
jgi:hypothetical protein